MSQINPEDEFEQNSKLAEGALEPGEPKNEDEDLESVNVPPIDMGEFADPAILAINVSGPPLRYTRDELIALRDAPLSKKRPEYLDAAFDNPNGIWDPEVWHYNRKPSDAPTENGSRNPDADNHRRRSGDPRERLRKEGDGIVLSPQRRSFNSGCYVPNRDPQRTNRSHSPLGKTDIVHRDLSSRDLSSRDISSREIGRELGREMVRDLGRDINREMGRDLGRDLGRDMGRDLTRDLPSRDISTAVPRRIGSGRIISWDYQEKQEADEFGYRRDSRRDNERDDRFDRRSFGRDFEMGRDKDKERHAGRNGRYDRHRMSTENKDKEPEWFSGGPLSQHDTIELRGFDDNDKGLGKKKRSAAHKKRSIDRAIAKNSEKVHVTVKEERGSEGHASPGLHDGSSDGLHSPLLDSGGAGDAPMDSKPESKLHEQPSIDLDDILKCDSFSGFMSNGVGNNESSGSRFSQWFSREKNSPPKHNDQDSRRSSIQDDHHHLIKNLLSDISEPNVSIPGDSDSYFAPISPAANTGGVIGGPGGNSQSKPLNLMEMLQRGKQQKMGGGDGAGPTGPTPSQIQQQKNIGKLLSLEELEARMLPGGGGGGDVGPMGAPVQTRPQQKPEDVESFKRLLAQVANSSHGIPQNGPIPQPQQAMSLLEMLSHSQQDEARQLANQMMGANPNLASPHMNDLSYKLQQVQNQVQRQQVEMMLSKIVRQQSRTPPPLPEMGLAQSRELLNRPEAQAILQAMHQRIPSPRELQVHTQNIMQRALIKKKLEEQQENFRKKQEMQQRGQSPGGGVSPAKNVASPTPLAFTPTSVLRKMTAEKEEAGRPIVKANTNFNPQPTSQQQEQVFQQLQQQQQQQRLFNQAQQQRKQQQSNQQFSGGNQQGQFQQFSNQQYNQLTQQQLRAQHQQQQQPVRQHPSQQPQQNYGGQGGGGGINWQQMLHGQNYDNRNNMQVGRPDAHGGDLSPTSNQLARWFSPELLERARKGKVPNLPSTTMAMHAMSLEDIERQAATPAVHN